MALSGLLVALTWQHVVGFSVLFLMAGFVVDYAMLPQYPVKIPAMGYGRGLWAHLKNSVAYFFCHRAWINEGYVKYGKKGIPFLVPAAISRPSDVVLPGSLLAWFAAQPASVLDAIKAHDLILYTDYNFLFKFVRDAFGLRAAIKFLTRPLTPLIPAIDDEVQHSCELALGHVGETWTSINLWHLWMSIVPRVTNRMLAGSELCRDEQFVQGMVNLTDAVIRNCLLMRMCPQALHPIFGRLLSIPNLWHWWSAHRRALPVIKQRLAAMKRQAQGDALYKDWAPPDDYISYLIRLALEEQRLEELKPLRLSLRLIPLEFASIHTTVLTGHAWLLDLLFSPDKEAILDVLGAEVSAHQPAPGAAWSKAALTALSRVDSSLRESQRISNFHTTLVERVVMPREGLRHPDFDWALPRGTYVTVNLEGTHHDEALFARARTYDALRFARIRERWARATPEERAASPEGRMARSLGVVTMTDQHFAFGNGKHACPGRFFVAAELKLVMAHLLRNYEMRSVGTRPQLWWLGSTVVPPFKTRIEIRRRTTTKTPAPAGSAAL